jgi:hypothetical protein
LNAARRLVARLRGPDRAAGSDPAVAALSRRVDHLEALVEGLQDAIHRRDIRQERDLADLARRTEPSAMTRSLAEHARERRID